MMKRFLSLLLSLVIILSLSSCGKTNDKQDSADASSTLSVEYDPNIQGNYTVSYQNTVKGYINHSNKGTFNIVADEGHETTDDFYLALPHDTKISCANPFAVFCYDEKFLLDASVMEEMGQTVDKLRPAMKSATYTLPYNTTVKFAVKGSLSDIKIQIPEGSEEIVTVGTKRRVSSMPKILSVKGNLDGKESNVNYLFLTDLHYGKDSASGQGKLIWEQVTTATEMANTIDAIDFIVIGGDTTTGMYESKANAIKYTQQALEPLKNCKKPVFVLMGNHDDNSYHRFTYDVYYPERIISDKNWSESIIKEFCPSDIVKDKSYADSKYYYYDLEAKKTRIICLDALDYRAEYDSEGNIAELPIKNASATTHSAKYWSGCSWWGYSAEQIKWLATEAMTAGEGWDYVFFSHMGIDSETNSYNTSVKYGSQLSNLIDAYQKRKTFSIEGVNADFSSAKGKILSYQFGHTHVELTHYTRELDLWQICTATANKAQNTTKDLSETSITNKNLDWHILDRSATDDSAYCFDIMSVGDTVINKYAYGAGSDEEMKH